LELTEKAFAQLTAAKLVHQKKAFISAQIAAHDETSKNLLLT